MELVKSLRIGTRIRQLTQTRGTTREFCKSLMSICQSRKWLGGSSVCRCFGNSDSLRTKRWTVFWLPCSRSAPRQPKVRRTRRTNSVFNGVTKLAHARCDDNFGQGRQEANHSAGGGESFRPAFCPLHSSVRIKGPVGRAA